MAKKCNFFFTNHNYFLQSATFFLKITSFYYKPQLFSLILQLFSTNLNFFYNLATIFYKPKPFSTIQFFQNLRLLSKIFQLFSTNNNFSINPNNFLQSCLNALARNPELERSISLSSFDKRLPELQPYVLTLSTQLIVNGLLFQPILGSVFVCGEGGRGSGRHDILQS